MFLYELAFQNGTVALVAFLLAFAVPYLIVYALHELRFRRLRLLKDYETSFSGSASARVAGHEDRDVETETPPPATELERQNVDLGSNPSFEFVRSKYVSDIDDLEFVNMIPGNVPRPATLNAASATTVAGKIDILLFKRPGFFTLKTNSRLMFTATAFGILTYLGFFFALICFHDGMAAACAGNYCERVFFTGGMVGDQTLLRHFDEQLRTVMALTFIGGYVSAVREFLRRMSVFDLSSYNFLKQAAEIFASVVFVAFLYRAFPNPEVMITGPAGWLFDAVADHGTTPPNAAALPGSLSFAWIALAPLFGLFPESASRYIFIRAGAFMNWIKSEDNRFNGVTRSVPIDVIDGIDFWTRIRLEQSGINDVQNLATFNPIMLYIETPYGFYQVFDWIAQAQLCHIIGIEKFLLFREINIRTIFDLERAIRSTEAPEQFDEIAVAILLATTSSMVMSSEISKLSPIISDGSGKAKPASVQEFSIWARDKLAPGSALNTAAVEHIANWISDDLHVRRLRLLWKEISTSLGEDSWHLPDDKSAVTRKKTQDTPPGSGPNPPEEKSDPTT